MRMETVSSDNIAAFGYDAATRTLRIEFHNGTYDYYDVPESVYRGLRFASSYGEYHAEYIRGVYRYSRL